MEKEAIKQKAIIMKAEVMLDDLGDPQTRSVDNSGLLMEQNIEKTFCLSDLVDFEQKIKDIIYIFIQILYTKGVYMAIALAPCLRQRE